MVVALQERAFPVARNPTQLPLSLEFAARLEEAGIRYCHFKSNQHLEDALQGVTDMDVLVDRRAGPQLAQILAELGCKRFSAPPGGDYPAVEDHLGFDRSTGRLLHLHLHHRLQQCRPRLLHSFLEGQRTGEGVRDGSKTRR